MESVEKQLTNQMEEHKAEIYDLKEKQRLEKNRLELANYRQQYICNFSK